MTKRFTGRHMTAILVGFFGLVVAVNVTMARYATSTFGGKLAENGYVASQDYNRWIAAAREQDKLGWTASARVEEGRLVIDTKGVEHPAAEIRLVHPPGRAPETAIAMRAVSASCLMSDRKLAPGRWQAHVVLKSGGKEARFRFEVAA